MSQDLRDYDLIRVDKNRDEAFEMSVTATVGPTNEDVDETRGVQLTMSVASGWPYARLSEPQIRDLIEVLEKRIDTDEGLEATGVESDNQRVNPDGSIDTDKEINQYD